MAAGRPTDTLALFQPRPDDRRIGAVFGLIGLWQAMDYRMRRRARLPLQRILMAILGLIVANIALFAILSGGLAWQAHLGGWIAGWLSGQSFARR